MSSGRLARSPVAIVSMANNDGSNNEFRCSSTTRNVDFALRWDDDSVRQATAIVDKCNVALNDANEVVRSLEEHKHFPHTSFFQRWFGDVQMLNERTSDVVRRFVTRAGRFPDDATIVDVFKANVRFQTILKTMWVVRYLLDNTLSKFVQGMREGRYYQRHQQQQQQQPIVVSSTDGGEPSSSEHDEDTTGTRNELRRMSMTIQSLLNQLPMLTGLLRVELDLLRVYDYCDDTYAVHEFLADPRCLAVMRRSCPRVADTLVHEWSAITSDDAVRNFDTIASDSQCVLDIRH